MEPENIVVRRTVLRRAEAELIERRSRFIATVSPTRSESEAHKFISEMREKYSDATHNVYAYYINGGASTRCSDDGEPQGSSGYPTLAVLKSSGADDLCVVVTRYFGGILLGTGGLARAYSGAARAAIDEAGFAVYEMFSLVRVTLGYSEHQKLSAILRAEGIDEENVEFTDSVSMTLALRASVRERILTYIKDITRSLAQITPVSEEERLVPCDSKK